MGEFLTPTPAESPRRCDNGEVDGRGQQWAPTAPQAMTTTERVAALWQLYEQLDALITADEIETYPVLEHLGDLIEDLQLELEE